MVAARIEFVARTNHWNEAQLLYNDEWRQSVQWAARGDGDAFEAELLALPRSTNPVLWQHEQRFLKRVGARNRSRVAAPPRSTL